MINLAFVKLVFRSRLLKNMSFVIKCNAKIVIISDIEKLFVNFLLISLVSWFLCCPKCLFRRQWMWTFVCALLLAKDLGREES